MYVGCNTYSSQTIWITVLLLITVTFSLCLFVCLFVCLSVSLSLLLLAHSKTPPEQYADNRVLIWIKTIWIRSGLCTATGIDYTLCFIQPRLRSVPLLSLYLHDVAMT